MNIQHGLRTSLRTLQLGSGLVLALAFGLLVAGRAAADSASIGRATIAPGSQGSVTLEAQDIGAPGLGAWSIDVIYDPDVVTVVGCTPLAESICNTTYAPNIVRIVGATASGHQGDTALATLTFSCDGAGASGLKIVLDEFADATHGSPQTIAADTVHGGITCSEQEGPSSVPTSRPPSHPGEEPTATPFVVSLPQAGSGGAAGGGQSWLIAALAGAGLAGLGLTTALRLRWRRA